MGFRVVNKSTLTFETDLPPSARIIHPSGVLHAARVVPVDDGGDGGGGAAGREEHAFAWIADSLHIDSAVRHLEARGFDREEGIAYIPYSSRRNWAERYPHAAPGMEYTEEGRWIEGTDGPGAASGVAGGEGRNPGVEDAASSTVRTGCGEDDETSDVDPKKKGKKVEKKRKKRKRSGRKPMNVLRDDSFLPDAERDELHIEIYNYLSWLHRKLEGVERNLEEACAAALAGGSAEGGADDERKRKGKWFREKGHRWFREKGVCVSALRGVLDGLEAAFSVVAIANEEAQTEYATGSKAKAEGGEGTQQQQQQPEGAPGSEEGAGNVEETAGPKPQGKASPERAPLLEEALSDRLAALAEARPAPRNRIRKRKPPPDKGENFEDLIVRFDRYKRGLDGRIGRADKKMHSWLRRLRERRAELAGRGLEHEEAAPGEPLGATTLTAERVARLDAVGFCWTVGGAREERWQRLFNELVEYRNEHGTWPTQTMGDLGMWVHKQRGCYSRRDASYMKHRAPKLDAIGFEWTLRGNTRMTWEKGLGLLLEFGRVNGHFEVPCPSGEGVDKKSEEFRLFRWVQSLHAMHRSYKLGQKSGSLTDERVALLTEHGFEFRSDLISE